jgi:hypothetical protein
MGKAEWTVELETGPGAVPATNVEQAAGWTDRLQAEFESKVPRMGPVVGVSPDGRVSVRLGAESASLRLAVIWAFEVTLGTLGYVRWTRVEASEVRPAVLDSGLAVEHDLDTEPSAG